jgi:protein-disulfide isomerase
MDRFGLMMPAGRVRQVVDLVVTLAMGVAAILIIWQAPGARSSTGPQTRPPAVQDVTSSNLVTNVVNTPVKGNANARVVIIEFSDFECPFCRKYFQDTFAQVDRQLIAQGKVQYAFRNFPLQNHSHAMSAAQAAVCASIQGKFWEMRRLLFERQPELNQGFWRKEAGVLGLNEALFERCLGDREVKRVGDDVAEASRLGAQVTPTFLVGLRGDSGLVRVMRKVEGAQPFGLFEGVVKEVLAAH